MHLEVEMNHRIGKVNPFIISGVQNEKHKVEYNEILTSQILYETSVQERLENDFQIPFYRKSVKLDFQIFSMRKSN